MRLPRLRGHETSFMKRLTAVLHRLTAMLHLRTSVHKMRVLWPRGPELDVAGGRVRAFHRLTAMLHRLTSVHKIPTRVHKMRARWRRGRVLEVMSAHVRALGIFEIACCSSSGSAEVIEILGLPQSQILRKVGPVCRLIFATGHLE